MLVFLLIELKIVQDGCKAIFDNFVFMVYMIPKIFKIFSNWLFLS